MSIRSPKARYGMNLLASSQGEQASRLSVPKYSTNPGGDSPSRVQRKASVMDNAPLSRTPLNHRKISYAAAADSSPFSRAGAVTELGNPMPRNSSVE